MAIISSDIAHGFRTVSSILGLAICFLTAGCGAFKPGGDEIGDGFLTEGGWDPFANQRSQPQSVRARDWQDDTATLEVPPEIHDTSGSGSPPPLSTVAGASSSAPSMARSGPASGAAEHLESLFKEGEYRAALAEAKKLRARSVVGSADRDVADFVAGASAYYLGKFQEAQPLLDSHVKQFSNSRHHESALYYQASNRVRLLQWRVAGGLLDR